MKYTNTQKQVEKIVSTILNMEHKLSIYNFITLNTKSKITVYYLAYYEQMPDTIVFKCNDVDCISVSIYKKDLRDLLVDIVGKLLRSKDIEKTFRQL